VTVEELKKLVAQARQQVARGSFLVRKAQGRQDKFHRKYEASRKARNRAHKAGKPKKEALYQRRMARAKRKGRYWTKREADAIEFARDWKAALRRRRRKLIAAQPKAGALVARAESYIGTRELGAQQRAWAARLGYSPYLPWCSIFVANMLMEAGICTKEQLPSNPAYSGAWFSWGRGQRVSESAVRPGDILVFDWGDGGMSDHVAIYEGGGTHVGGNQSDAVTRSSTPWGNVVGVVRPL
jgi:CHAP domain